MAPEEYGKSGRRSVSYAKKVKLHIFESLADVVRLPGFCSHIKASQARPAPAGQSRCVCVWGEGCLSSRWWWKYQYLVGECLAPPCLLEVAEPTRNVRK